MSVPEDRDAAFVAKVTASATHEIRNVLAIIKESAGLIGDVIQASSSQALSNTDKVVRAVGRIDAQVSRGAELIANLNRFAHSLDRVGDATDLNQVVQQVAFLCQRLARQGRHQIQVQPDDRVPPTGGNPLWLQMALFAAIECCFDQLPEGATLTIRTGRRGERPSAEFVVEAAESAARPLVTRAASWGELTELLDRLGASVEASTADGRLVVVLPVAEIA